MTILSTDNRKNFSTFPLVWLAASFAVGIGIANWVDASTFSWLTTILIAIAATIFYSHRTKFQTATIILLLAFLLCGAFSRKTTTAAIAPDRIARIYDAGQINFKTPIEIVGVLQNEPEETPSGYFLLLKVEQLKFAETAQTASGAVRLFLSLKNQTARLDYEQLDLHYGARIHVSTKLTRENQFRNLGGGNFKQFLAGKDLDAIGAIKDLNSIQKLGETNVFLPLQLIYRWRANLVRQFNARFSTPTAGVLSASLLNNRYLLDKQTAEKFREGGTFHVLVISGAHITFIGLLIAWLIRFATRNLSTQFFAANALLWAFAIAVGAETPVTRAALMFTIFHAAALANRRHAPLNGLGAASLILLVWKPVNLFDQSFQLTFVSVAAIVGAALPILDKMRQIGAWELTAETPVPPCCSRWFKILCETLFWSERAWQRSQERQTWKAALFKSNLAKRFEGLQLQVAWRFVFSSILISIIVSAWLLPLTAVYFHRFSPAAILLNVFVGALIAATTFAGIFAVLIAQVSQTLAQPFVAWTEAFSFLLIYSSEPFFYTNTASVRLPVYTGATSVFYVIYYLPLIVLTARAHRWNPFELSIGNQQPAKNRVFKTVLIAAYCLLLTVIILHPFSAQKPDGRLHVEFLDVGQGDAALITTPNGTTVLVDGGGRPSIATKIQNQNGETKFFESDTRSIGEAVVSEFLWNKGLSKIDFLVSTHADHDHIDGLNDVANNFRVNTAFVGRTPANDAEFQRFAETLQKRGIPIQKVERGDVLEIDNVRIEVLLPIASIDENALSDNNNSIVIRVVYGSRAFLLTADVEAQAERFLLAQAENLNCDVIKVAHHGSKTSSTVDFGRATNAKFAVISVGRESPYNHPHPEVVTRWQNLGAKTMTTGENGTISFSSDGTDLDLQTFVRTIERSER